MRVVIVEDQVLLREGLARLFADRGHDVVATRGDAEGLLPFVQEHSPDLVILDVRMPPTYTDEGIRAAADLKAVLPRLGVLVLSQHVETVHPVSLIESHVRRLFIKLNIPESANEHRRVLAVLASLRGVEPA